MKNKKMTCQYIEFLILEILEIGFPMFVFSILTVIIGKFLIGHNEHTFMMLVDVVFMIMQHIKRMVI